MDGGGKYIIQCVSNVVLAYACADFLPLGTGALCHSRCGTSAQSPEISPQKR